MFKYASASLPFNLTATGFPFPYDNDGNKFAALFNQLYTTGVTGAYGTPVFSYFPATPTPMSASTPAVPADTSAEPLTVLARLSQPRPRMPHLSTCLTEST